METTKINRNSWTYKVASFFGQEEGRVEDAKDICAYRWLFIKNFAFLSIMFIMVVTILVTFLAFNYQAVQGIWDMEYRPLTYIGLVVYTMFGSVIAWNIWGSPYLKEKKHERFMKRVKEGENGKLYVQDKEKNKNVIATFYRTWKEKTCHKVEFYSEKDEE